MLFILVALNFYFSRYELDKFKPRYNIDLPSYFQQVGMFWRGDTNYERLEGEQGSAYYPAGQLWFHLPFYLGYFTWGMPALKITHILIFTISKACVTNLSYKYFKLRPEMA